MYRVTYSKEGLIKFISHLDLTRVWQRAFRRAGLPVRMSQGFSPHPLISFGPPLPVGVGGLNEVLDVSMPPHPGAGALTKVLQEALPDGMRVKEVRPVKESSGSLCAAINSARYEAVLGGEREEEVQGKVAAARAAKDIVIRKRTKKGERYRDIKPLIEEIVVERDSGGRALLCFTVSVGEKGNLNCRDFLQAVLGWPVEEVAKLPVTRTALYSR